jgi:GTP-binding protein Era
MTRPADPESPEAPQTARAGRCALVGRANVGKSTLLNALLGQKLVIVTPTPGTTRSSVLGVYASTDPPTQIAFVDTPGRADPNSALAKVLLDQTRDGLREADVVVFLTSPGKKTAPPKVHPRDEETLRLLDGVQAPTILAINKVDELADKRHLLPLIDAYQKRYGFDAVVPISALEKTQLTDLVSEIRARLPEGLLYDEETLTDRPERFFAAELIREAILRHTREEVPHGSAVLIDEFREEGERVHINATVVVEKESHKKIVIGRQGSLLKEIGTAARLEIEQFLGRRAYVGLWVKVVPGWTRDAGKARKLVEEGTS